MILRLLGRTQLHHDLILVTPEPVLTRFKGFDNRMMSLPEMLGGMFIFRGITTADMATSQAFSKMNPGISH
jgi:hypothetical protein